MVKGFIGMARHVAKTYYTGQVVGEVFRRIDLDVERGRMGAVRLCENCPP